jgi:hypothetical protein
VLLIFACQSDEEQFPVSVVFGEWVDERGFFLTFNEDYTYSRMLGYTKYGFYGLGGSWSYHNSRVVFIDGHGSSLGLDSLPASFWMPPNAANVLSVTQDQLMLEFLYQAPFPKKYHGKDTTIVYKRRE